MFRRLYLGVIAISVFLAIALGACGRGKAAEEATPAVATPVTVASAADVTTQLPAPTATPLQPTTIAAAPTHTPTAASTQAPSPTATASPTPLALVNGKTPAADEVSVKPAEQELSTVDVVKILKPSVVQIVTEIVGMGMFNQPIPGRGVGTGVVLDQRGHILTNNHVIQRAQRLTVTLSNGESFPAQVVGSDFTTDLAVIRISADGLVPARLGVSAEVQVGEDVVAIGHALGLKGGPTVSKGVVSALGRSIDTDARTTIVDLIQTDSSINPGNSGGPLVNDRAEVIGINTAITEGGRGIGFAINIDDAKVVVAQLLKTGSVNRGFLGISPFNLDPGLAKRLNLAVDEGIIVARVIPGTAAEEAGLQVEDVIVQLGEVSIVNTGELSKFLMTHPPGDTVEVVFYRGSTKKTAQITLRQRPTG